MPKHRLAVFMRTQSRTSVALITSLALAGCATNLSSGLPRLQNSPFATNALRSHQETIPGEGANALPGAVLGCAFDPSPGQGNCTLATNVTIPPIGSPLTPASLIPGLHPGDLEHAYALPASEAGQRVAIVDAYDDPMAESDLNVYRSTFGLPTCTSATGCFKKINEQGQPGPLPAMNLPWAKEIALDLEMVSASCPRCSLLLVEAKSASIDDLGSSVDEAVARGARIVSNSYYAFEWANEMAEDAHYHHAGVAITVSSGDAAETFYPAASPHVTAVGGTSLALNNGVRRETPWKFGGRGCSLYEPLPRFQRNFVKCDSRSTVDLAAVADPSTGVATFETAGGGWFVAGGTSVGAPLVAGAYALSATPRGPAFSYRHLAGFRPIGKSRYHLATGLGALDGIIGL